MKMNLLSTLKIFKIFMLLIFCVAITQIYAYENKYSEDSNMEVLHLRDPLRMAKLNVIWEKARKRLSEPKLRKLLSELKVQDKEELTFKKLKASGGDKEGLKEAELRKRLRLKIFNKLTLFYTRNAKLIFVFKTPLDFIKELLKHMKCFCKNILKKFALEHHDDVEDENKHLEKKLEKAIFKDKKLHKLWLKAEQSGLTLGPTLSNTGSLVLLKNAFMPLSK
ncbi:Alpha-2-macroglobulin receptor-associated protein, partial [Armadillidium nasatum]